MSKLTRRELIKKVFDKDAYAHELYFQRDIYTEYELWSLIPNNTKRRYGFATTRVGGGNKKKKKRINKVHLARKSYDFIEEKYRDMVREAVYEIMGSMCDYKTVAEGDRNIYANTENSKEDILINLIDDPY